jgi:DNA-binding CsgD family transcriptional regulator
MPYVNKKIKHIDYGKLFTNLPCAVFWKNKQSVIIGGNDYFIHHLGFNNLDAVVGKNLFQVPAWTHEEAIGFLTDNRQVLESRKEKLGIIEKQTVKTSKIIITNKMPLKNANGETIGLLGVYFDISHMGLMKCVANSFNNLSFPRESKSKITLNTFTEFIKLNYPKGYFLSQKNVYLSHQELKCLLLLSQGKIMKTAADEMNISPRTFESYINNIKMKVGYRSKQDLINLFQTDIMDSIQTSFLDYKKIPV